MKSKRLKMRLLSGLMALVMLVSTLIAGGAPTYADSSVKIVLLLGTEAYASALSEAYRTVKEDYDIELKIIGSFEAKAPERLEDLKREAASADIFLMEMLGSAAKDTIAAAMKEVNSGCKVYMTRGTDYSSEFPMIDPSLDAQLAPYFVNGGVENMKRMLLFLGSQGGTHVDEPMNPVVTSPRMAYHPEAVGIPFDADAFYEAVGTRLEKEDDDIQAGILLNTLYRAVYDNATGVPLVTTPSVNPPVVTTSSVQVVTEGISPVPGESETPGSTETPDPTEAPAPTEASDSSEAPAPTEASDSTEAPAPTEGSDSTEAPAPTEASDSTEAPARTEASDSTEAPAPTEASDSTEAPAPTEASDSTEAPAPTEATDSTEAPAPTVAPIPTEALAPTTASEGNPITAAISTVAEAVVELAAKLLTNGEETVTAQAITSEELALPLMSMAISGKEDMDLNRIQCYDRLYSAENFIEELKVLLNENTTRLNRLQCIDAAWSVALSKPMDAEARGALVNGLNQTICKALGARAAAEEQSEELLQAYTDIRLILGTPSCSQGTFRNRETFIAWYQASGKHQPGAPWIGVVAHNSMFFNNDVAMYTAVQKSLEAKGANVILLFSDINRQALHDEFLVVDTVSKIDVLIASIGFNYISGKPDAGAALFKSMDIPVLSPIYSGDVSNWEQCVTGFQSEINYQVALPEMDGRIEPILMGGAQTQGFDPDTGAAVTKRIPLGYNIERLAGRAMTWARLKTQRNSQKKVALVYYNHDGGKDGISASYLNVTKSIVNTLKAMKEQGYEIDSEIDAETLKKQMFEQGRNVGNWAPGEIEKLVKAGAMTVSVDAYMEWYNTLPQKLREDIEKDWGPAPGNTMIYDNKIIIPGIMLSDKVYLGPQPMRGWMEGTGKIAHSATLSPPHQYVAYYLWLQREFQADAVIHMGTHGTLEWLPGHSVGLGETDWPDQLIGNMANINPYIVNNPGEATQAKRRGYAVTISHMIPVMLQPQLYGDLEKIQNLIIQYEKEVVEGNSDRIALTKAEIVALVDKTGIDADLNLDLEADFDNAAEILHEYLETFSENLMPYGLHTLGEFPEGDLRNQMVDAIVGFDPEARAGERSAYASALARCTEEIQSVIAALAGRFVEPGPGKDPIRTPDAMPTGRNIISFDSREVPDKAAWEIGKNAADQLVLEYQRTHGGKTPESVGVVLWAIETMRTRGESVAMILRLIGTEPVWDKNGRVASVKVTPVSQLGRPRIDTVVTISGIFRDTFPTTIDLLDTAFRQVAMLNESGSDNYLKKHRDALYDKLISEGKSAEEADLLAGARIFGDAPGTYGTGVADRAEGTADWESQQDLLDTYMNRMSYIYGKGISGQYSKDAFLDALSHVEAVIQIRDSIYGVLDNDDVAQYLGGLLMAAKSASGKDVAAYIADTRKPGDDMVKTLKEFTATELRTRIFNPEWIEGMLSEGADGAREIAKQIANMFLMDATTDVIDDKDWAELVKSFIGNEAVLKALDPYAAQSIIGWAMEASRRELWKAEEGDLAKLADGYIQSAIQYGVVCCHHTCANLRMDEYLASFSTLDNSQLAKFKEIFKASTQQELDIKMKEAPVPNLPPANPGGTPVVAPAVPAADRADPAPLPVTVEAATADSGALSPETPIANESVPAGAAGIPATPATAASPEQQSAPAQAQSSGEGGPQKSEPAPQEAPREAGESKKAQAGGRAFEMIEKAAHESASRANGVSMIAVVLALVLGGMLALGYIKKRRPDKSAKNKS